MPTERPKLDPVQAPQITQVAADAMEEILTRSSLDALLKATPDQIIAPNPNAEVIKGTAYRSGGWLHGPAQLELFAAADKRLTVVASDDNMTLTQVEKVQVRLIKGTKLVVLKAAHVNDLTAIPVNRYVRSSTAWINLISLLGEAGLTIDSGYKERFDVAWVPKASPLWPGLVIDLGDPKERRAEAGAKKKASKPTTPSAE